MYPSASWNLKLPTCNFMGALKCIRSHASAIDGMCFDSGVHILLSSEGLRKDEVCYFVRICSFKYWVVLG